MQDDHFERALSTKFDHARELLLKKHRDYGPYNISRAPGGPLIGVSVRLHDKIARVANVLAKGAAPANESLRDSFADIANYGIIALMVMDGDWPK